MKKWVHKTDLLKIRPAVDGEMVAPGQFAKHGDMIVTRAWPDDDFLVTQKDFENYIEVEVAEQS